jgi:hypothetical protein
MDRVPEGLYEQVLETLRRVDGWRKSGASGCGPSGAKVFVDDHRRAPTTPFQGACDHGQDRTGDPHAAQGD